MLHVYTTSMQLKVHWFGTWMWFIYCFVAFALYRVMCRLYLFPQFGKSNICHDRFPLPSANSPTPTPPTPTHPHPFHSRLPFAHASWNASCKAMAVWFDNHHRYTLSLFCELISCRCSLDDKVRRLPSCLIFPHKNVTGSRALVGLSPDLRMHITSSQCGIK